MKTCLASLSLLLALFLATGCQPKQNPVVPSPNSEEAQVAGSWELVKITAPSMVAGQPDASWDPHFKETLVLETDGTFRKTRSNGYQAKGTYTSKLSESGKPAVTLTFAKKELNYYDFPTHRFQPSPEGQAYLEQSEPGVLIESYIASDGYSFVYHKVAATN